MKRIFRFVILAVALVAAACTEDLTTDPIAEDVVENEIYDGEMVRLAIDVTRASLNGLDMAFQQGDVVSVNGKNISVRIDKSGAYLYVPKAEDDIYRAVFPALAAQTLADENNYAYVQSNMQLYNPGSFGREAMCLTAYADLSVSAEESPLRFNAMLGVLKLTVKGDAEVRSIRLQNNAFDPANSYTAMSGRSKFVTADGSTLGPNKIENAHHLAPYGYSGMTEDIVLICNDADGQGVQLSPSGTDFYFAIYPQEYAEGFTVTISDNEGKSQRFSTSGSTNVPVNTLVAMQPMTYAPASDLIFSESFDVCVYGGDVVAYRNGSSVWRSRTPILQPSSVVSGLPILKSHTDQDGLQPGYYLTNNATAKGGDKQTVKAVVAPGLIFGDWVAEGENSNATMSAFAAAGKLNVTPELLNVRGFNDWYLSRCIEFHGYVAVGNEHALNSTSTYKFSMNPLGMLITPYMTAINGTSDVEVSFDIAAGDGVTGYCKKDTPSSSSSFYTYLPDATEEDQENNIYWREDKFRFSIVGDIGLATILKLEFVDKEGNVLVKEDGTLMSYESSGAYVDVPESDLPETWARVKVLVKNANAQTRFRFYNNQATRYMVYHIDNIEVRKADLSYIPEDANVTGTVTCEGEPMQGVVVSDGEHVTRTDAEGRYYLQSDLSTASHVFITIPSGYEMTGRKNKIAPAFFAALKDSETVQICDFQLKKVDQSNYTILVMADSHVLKGAANFGSTEDLTIFRNQFLPKWNSYANECLAKGPTYGIHLGDMTQRGYWKKSTTILGYTFTYDNYTLGNYCSDLKSSPVPIFSVIGNHDHDIPKSGTFGEDEQHLARKSFAENVGPAYYSFDIGNEHYIVLDNTMIINNDSGTDCYNDTKATGYKVKIDSKQLQWLKDDVAQIDPAKIKGVVICAHCQFYYANKGLATIRANEVMAAVSKFPVTLLIGHSHIDRYIEATTPTYGKSVREYIHTSLSGTAWLTLMSKDGSPAAFSSYTFANGKTASRTFIPFGENERLTYRAYDKDVKMEYAITEGSYSARITDDDDTSKTAPAVIVNAWGVRNVSFTESTGGTGKVVTTPLYDPFYRDWYYASMASSDRNSVLCNKTYPEGPDWQHPYNGGTHIWKYIPANPNATITATLADEFGNSRTLTLTAK